MCRCECTEKDDEGDSRECAVCFSSQSWTATFAGPVEKSDDRVARGLDDHFPPTTSDKTTKCSNNRPALLGNNEGSTGFNSNLYVAYPKGISHTLLDWGSGVSYTKTADAIFTEIGDPYCPPVYDNIPANVPDDIIWYMYTGGAIWGTMFQEGCQNGILNAGNNNNNFIGDSNRGGTAQGAALMRSDVDLYGFYKLNKDAIADETFEKTLSVTCNFYRYGGPDNVMNPDAGLLGRDVAPQRTQSNESGGAAFNVLARGYLKPFRDSTVKVGYWSGIADATQGTFDDEDGTTHTKSTLVKTTEEDRKLFVIIGNWPNGGAIYDTGKKISDVVPGGFNLQIKVIQTGVTVETAHGGFDVDYSIQAKIPTLTFDKTKTGFSQKVYRCEQGAGSISIQSLARQAVGFPGRVFTAGNPFVDSYPGATILSNACASSWEDHINDGLPDDNTRVQYLPSVSAMSIDGTQTENAGFRLRHVTWHSALGDQHLDALDDYNDVTIPHGETWDIGSAQVGDTMTMHFDNLGSVTVEVTDVTMTDGASGGLLTAVDKTTETFLPFQAKNFGFTGPTAAGGIGAETTVTIDHDQGGNFIQDLFEFTVKASLGIGNPPP